MFRFTIKRLIESILVLYLIATIVFFMMKAVPGGPFSQERNTSEFIQSALEQQYGLSDSLLTQYSRYLFNIAPKKLNFPELMHMDLEKGLGINLGHSYRYEGRKVNDLIKTSFPVSLELGIYALIFAGSVGGLVGVVAALKQNSKLDYLSMTVMTSGICIPAFVLGPLLILVFGFILPEPFRLPILFWEPPINTGIWANVSHKILPTLTLGLFYAASIARLTRGSMIEVFSKNFIRTARAKGLSETTIVLRHALRAGIIPVISYLGPVTAHLITGSFVVEYIFGIPGLGRHLINASLNRDYTMIMGTVLLYACILITFNLIVDILVIALNPKARFSES